MEDDGSQSSMTSKRKNFTPQRHSKQRGGGLLQSGNSRNSVVSPLSISNSSRSSRGKTMRQQLQDEVAVSPNRGKGTMHAFFAPKDSSLPSDTISPKVTPSSTTAMRSNRGLTSADNNRKRNKRKAEAAQENRDSSQTSVQNNKPLKSRKKIQVQEEKEEKNKIKMPPSPVMMNVASNGVVERLKRELDVVKKSENLLRDEVKRLLTQNEESLKQYVRLSIREMRSNTQISLSSS